MPLHDLSATVTAKSIGPRADTPLTAAKVFYLKASELLKQEASNTNGNAIIFVNPYKKKVELYETPDELAAMQLLSQGTTASSKFAAHFAAVTPTSSATAADQTALTAYYSEINAVGAFGGVKLPDPFTKRLCVVQNFTGTSVSMYPNNTTSTINGSTAAYVMPARKRVHFVGPTASTAGSFVGWRVAKDA
jgi:hypothetical protein